MANSGLTSSNVCPPSAYCAKVCCVKSKGSCRFVNGNDILSEKFISGFFSNTQTSEANYDHKLHLFYCLAHLFSFWMLFILKDQPQSLSRHRNKKNTLPFTYTVNLKGSISLTCVCLDCGKTQPSCCEAATLTTMSP